MTIDPTVQFEQHRSALVGAAYRILGSRVEAEDVVQEAWIRWADVDHDSVEEPRAYLLTVTSRLALNRVRQLSTRRETYVGPWLPEPVASDPDPRADGAAAAQLADEVSMAMLIVLESLSPLERAAFVLTEVFAMPAPEVAAALDRSPAAVRQLVHRARSHVEARQPRQQVSPDRHREITEQFMSAAAGGDVTRLLEILSPDVVLVTDGGGLKQAALRPIHGVEKVLRFFVGVMSKPESAGATFELRHVNGEPAIVVNNEGALDGVFFLTVEDDRITALHGIRNPEKLGAL
ncbi:MAG: polymerase sigma-70 factor [Marmoricola sp.]|jgi:RNA polymerase sigma-70 factor (ECF subfamily)|nr:polymerase sigma-70 factor [Marmoricola sp.]